MCTLRWGWRWCARCVEAGIKGQKKLDKLEAKRSELESEILGMKHEVQRTIEIREEERREFSRLRVQRNRDQDISEHMGRVEELKDELENMQEALQEAKQLIYLKKRGAEGRVGAA